MLKRASILISRNKKLSRAKVFQGILLSLVMIPAFLDLGRAYNLDQPSLAGPQSLSGAIYYLTVTTWITNYVPNILNFQQEAPLYRRERVTDMYDIWVYVFTKWVAELPVTAFVPAIVVFMVYYAVPFVNRGQNFLMFYIILALQTQAAIAIGQFQSAFFESETKAVGFSTIIGNPVMLFGGFYISLNGIMKMTPQKFIAWFQYISPVRWAF